MEADPEIRIREIRNFFFAFFASTDLLGPQGHPPDGPESPNPDPDREIRFFENPDFSTKWKVKVSINKQGDFIDFDQVLYPYLKALTRTNIST